MSWSFRCAPKGPQGPGELFAALKSELAPLVELANLTIELDCRRGQLFEGGKPPAWYYMTQPMNINTAKGILQLKDHLTYYRELWAKFENEENEAVAEYFEVDEDTAIEARYPDLREPVTAGEGVEA